MTELNVVQLPVKDLSDIPTCLRDLANRIESGEQLAETAFVLIPQHKDYPRLYGWGNIDHTNDPIIQLGLCLNWLHTNLVTR